MAVFRYFCGKKTVCLLVKKQYYFSLPCGSSPTGKRAAFFCQFFSFFAAFCRFNPFFIFPPACT